MHLGVGRPWSLGKGEDTMAGLQTILSYLNGAFSRERIAELAAQREAFAPGRPLAAGVVIREGTRLHGLWVDYLGKLPKSFQEALRATVYYALSTEPPTPITFAWGPGYDYELTMWHSPDTPPTMGGITILLKSRYPGDQHPAAVDGSFPEAKP
jgi:hypothetical protein